MKITWEEYAKIAEALSKKFIEIDLVNITDDQVIKMVLSLDDFEGAEKPSDPDLIDAIVNVWAQLLDDSGYDDSRYDAYA